MNIIKIKWITLAICLFTVGLWGKTTINNPKKPVNSNSGRQIPLKILATFADDGENFFFKWPSHIKISPNGSLYALDQDQLILLSPEGKFIKNLWQKGQGASEMVNVSDYILLPNNEVMVHNLYPNKMLSFDGAGKYIQEKRLEPNKPMTFFHQDSEHYYFYREYLPETKGRAIEGVVDVQIFRVSKKDNSYNKLMSFPVINYFFRVPNNIFQIRTTRFLIEHFKENKFWVAHTADYKIKLIDLNSQKILMEFNRPYNRIEVTEKNKEYITRGGFVIDDIQYKSPIPKYMNDVQSIHAVAGKLWVFTSTVTDKGVLVDVFDEHGKYVDCFYLKFRYERSDYRVEQSQLTKINNYIYYVEQNPDEDWAITKYEMPASLK